MHCVEEKGVGLYSARTVLTYTVLQLGLQDVFNILHFYWGLKEGPL